MSITPPQPGRLRHWASSAVMAATGMLCRAFLYGLNDVQVVGLDKFLALLDARRDVDKRTRGLVTVSNHISVLDDPFIWGVLPWRYTLDSQNLRWGLGAHNICFRNSLTGKFFFTGQTLPTHRLLHSPYGGLFQPTMTQAIRLLSGPSLSSSLSSSSPLLPVTSTPSTSSTYSANGTDRWPCPASFAGNHLAWVHLFPEGGVHQQGQGPGRHRKERSLRYFKWGVARLLLESEPAPDLVPMFIDGFDTVMAEDRGFPRFLPRVGKTVRVVFGDVVGPEAFADLRERWHQLKTTGDAQNSPEAQKLRIEVAERVRNEVLKLRRQQGFPEEDPALRLAETWSVDPHTKRYRSKVDGSLINED